MTTLREAEEMSLYEYRLRLQGNLLKQVDREYELHLQAWLMREIKAERTIGKDKTEPVYKRFDKFFDYDQRISKVKRAGGFKAQDSGLRQVARRLEQLREEGMNGEL